MVHTMALHDSGPSAVRYPRGEGGACRCLRRRSSWRSARAGSSAKARRSPSCRWDAACRSGKGGGRAGSQGLSTTVADLRFAKPLDGELIRRLMVSHEVAVTVEEAAIGGLGAHVLTLASDEGLLDAGLKIRTMRLPDRFQEHDKPEKQYDEARLNAPHIVETVLKALRVNSAGVEEVRA